MTINKAFALRISELLNENKISKYKLEKETGITHSALRYIFNEVNKDVKFSTVIKVASFFNMTVSQFLDSELFDFENLEY